MSLPHNDQIEKGILAACLLDSAKLNQLGEEGITPEFFYNAKHQLLCEVMPQVHRERGVADDLTVMEWLMEKPIRGTVAAQNARRSEWDDKLIKILPIDYLTGITSNIESTANFSSWVQILRELHQAREFAQHLNEQYQAVCDQPSTIQDRVEETASWVINQNTHESETLKLVSEVAHDAYHRLEQTRTGEIPPGVRVGLTDLDRFFSMKPGSMTVLAARPSMGKSALGLMAGYNNARRAIPVPTLIFSLEMTNIELTQRIFAMHGNVNTKLYEDDRSHVTPFEMQSIAGEVESIGQRIILEEAAPINVFRIRATARRMKLHHNIGLIVIDYLQLADADNTRLPREQAIGEISRNCKLMAKELNVPVLALAQLNREVEKREPPRPRLSDLRDSGTLEQDADNVIFISPSTKDEDGKFIAGGRMVIDVAKQRGGPTGSFPVFFRKEFVKFENYTRHEANDEN